MFNKHLKNQKGMVLIFVIIVFGILFTLGIVTVNLSGSDQGQSIFQEKKMQAHYLARSGAEALGKHIVDQSKVLSQPQLEALLTSISNITSDKIKLDSNDNGYFQVLLQRKGDKIDIISTRMVGNAKDTVVLSLDKMTESVFSNFKNALFVSSKLTFTGSTKILGSVVTNFNASSQINFSSSGGQYITEDLYLLNSTISKDGIPYGNQNIKGKIKSTGSTMTFSMPVFPNFDNISASLPVINTKLTAGWNPSPPFYSISTSGWYKQGIEVQSRLDINVGSQDVIIRTKDLVISGSGGTNRGIYVHRTGAGKLYIYVDGVFSVTGSGVINPDADGSPDNCLIFFKSSDFSPAGEPIIKSLLYGENATITLGGSGDIQGDVITGGSKVTINGAAVATVKAIYAPNAIVNIDGSGKVKGTVISQQTNLTGAAYIEYADLSGDSNLNTIFGKTSYTFGMWK